jgi:hypothetical protein
MKGMTQGTLDVLFESLFRSRDAGLISEVRYREIKRGYDLIAEILTPPALCRKGLLWDNHVRETGNGRKASR